MAPFLPPMIAVTPDETTPPLSHIVSTVVKFFTEYFILVSDWITDHLPEAQEWVTSHPFHVAAAIVGVVLLIFVFVPWILSWVALAVNAVWSGLKSIFQLVWRSLQWFGRAFVHCLGFRTKGVTKGSISRVWLLHVQSLIFLRLRCCALPIPALRRVHSCWLHLSSFQSVGATPR
ncbi:hypothetical protein EDD16DRAFT_1567543 [Pisolithus croceorrhizus]|nr:hypothetical protein EDD16DRAFT_1567543 [Pisolithus croceorrhizus]